MPGIEGTGRLLSRCPSAVELDLLQEVGKRGRFMTYNTTRQDMQFLQFVKGCRPVDFVRIPADSRLPTPVLGGSCPGWRLSVVGVDLQ